MFSEKDLKATINTQKNEISRQRKELTESIRYASYIQKALLPPDSLLNKVLPDYFIFYKPKDIVSGDFYWATKRKNDIIIAVADCTGHGVPGAFMSILGITVLSEVINRGCYSSSGSVLNQIREKIMKSLNQTGLDAEQKDGIDMSLCILHNDSGIFEYSGAFNPAYIIKKQNLIEIPGDKMPIGIAADEEKSFTTNRLQLDPGDMVYFFSDGFVDQFGGPEGKKFKYKPFRNLFLRINQLPLNTQKEEISKVFESWKNGYPQLDDVLILGFRYNVYN